MRIRSRFLLAVVVIAAAVSSACTSCQPPPPKEQSGSPTPSGSAENQSATKKRAIVFVHGIHGSSVDTWQADNGANWVNLVKNDPAFKDADVFNPGYPTPFTGNKNDVVEIAQALGKDLSDIFATHSQVVFVCHSLGGLIVEELVLERPDYAAKIPFIVFYATPHSGAFVARFAAFFAGDPLLKSMSNSGDNEYLIELENRWRSSHYQAHRYCAYEQVKMSPQDLAKAIAISLPPGVDAKVFGAIGMFVVDPFSATYGCDSNAPFVGIQENHLTIVKPPNTMHKAYTLFQDFYAQIPTATQAHVAEPPIRYEEPLCVLYGEANSGGRAWFKTEVCPIKNRDQLDPDYHQINFVCCGGGATSPMTTADIPAGIEVRTDGGYYWSVANGRREGDNYRIDTYCGPGGNGLPGCNVKTMVVGHYRVMKQQ